MSVFTQGRASLWRLQYSQTHRKWPLTTEPLRSRWTDHESPGVSTRYITSHSERLYHSHWQSDAYGCWVIYFLAKPDFMPTCLRTPVSVNGLGMMFKIVVVLLMEVKMKIKPTTIFSVGCNNISRYKNGNIYIYIKRYVLWESLRKWHLFNPIGWAASTWPVSIYIVWFLFFSAFTALTSYIWRFNFSNFLFWKLFLEDPLNLYYFAYRRFN